MKILEFLTLKISAQFKCLQLDTQYKKLPTFYIFQKKIEWNKWIITNKHPQEVEEDIIFLRSKTFIRHDWLFI